MIRFYGGLMLFLAGIMGGYLAKNQLSKRVRLLEGMMSLIGFLRRGICEQLAPLPEVLRYSETVLTVPMNSAVREIGRGLTEGKSFSVCWDETLSGFERDGLSRDEIAALSELGRFLGRYSAEEQKRCLDKLSTELELYIKYAKEARDGRGKAYTVLGACGGVAVALLLV